MRGVAGEPNRNAGSGKGTGGAMSPIDGERRALLHLRLLPGIGDLRLWGLLKRFGSARAALEAPTAALGARAAEARGSRRVRERLDRAVDTIGRLGIRVFCRGAPDYPARLERLHDPPAVLFALGRVELLERVVVAVVGTRRCTEYGAAMAKAITEDLSRMGAVIASGLALGIDGAAHAAALEGGTIAVLGCGIDVPYPRQHARLQERIGAEGLLLSEFMPGEPADRPHFPKRNRILAAISHAVVVVEAPAKSGALITVDHALDLGLEVGAVPGPVGRRTSEGTNRLIQEGAHLVTNGADVVHYCKLHGLSAPRAAKVDHATSPPPVAGPSARQVWNALGHEPSSVDELATRTGLGAGEVLAALLELELVGTARQVAGQQYARV